MQPVEKKWVVVSGIKNGSPAILRLRENIDAETRNKFPGFLLFTWLYDGGASGMPDQKLQMEMGDLEDKVFEALEEKNLCQHVLTNTHNGKAEFFVYVADVEKLIPELDKELDQLPPMPISINHYNDPAWEGYDYWLKMAQANA